MVSPMSAARVTSDHVGIGRLAAMHFAERNWYLARRRKSHSGWLIVTGPKSPLS